ncbi:MAG: ATP-binding cassette domain-containing protein [Bacteroidales bacterium]|nr:ATP-binding cassette domain-containing protein [Bacteroidales bacterium]
MQSLNDKTIIRGTGLSIDYGSTPVLADVSLSINDGDFVAITGPNGGGKSSLLKVLLKLLKPTQGSVEYFRNGNAVDTLLFGYLPQKNNIDSRFPITVEEVVASGLFADRHNLRGRFSAETKRQIDDTLELMGIADLRRRVIGALSGGQLQRALLGRAIISKPSVVVLDEPLSYIDRNFVEQIYKIVEQISKTATVIVVSHEMTVISELANRHWLIDHSLTECHASHHFLRTECDV